MARDEQALLATFRKELEEDDLIHEGDSIGTDDATLLRFLRARNFSVSDAKVMILNCQAWRNSIGGVGIDELYRRIDPFDYPERTEAFKYWPLWFHQTDKCGRPLNIQSFGSIDMDGLYSVLSPERHWHTVCVNADALVREVLPGASRRAGKRVEQVFVIVDLKGFSLSQFWQMKSAARKSFQVSQDYFPETLGKLVILNAPSSFTMVWAVIKPWLSKETVEKVEILGSNFKEYLLTCVDANMLPAVLGGKCSCPGGCDISNSGPWMDHRKERRAAWLRGDIARAGDDLPEEKNGFSDTSAEQQPSEIPRDTKAAPPTTENNLAHSTADTKGVPSAEAVAGKNAVSDQVVGEKEIVPPSQSHEAALSDITTEREENPLPAMSRMELSI